MDEAGMKSLCRSYVKRSALIGALYCIVPTAVWFLGMFALQEFRGAYVLRMVIALTAGATAAAVANCFAVKMWVAKHFSPRGPATVFDGVLLGVAAGWGTALVPPLTALIRSNHIELAKTFVIVAWLIAAAIGAALGGFLSATGRRHLDADPEATTPGGSGDSPR